jgi:hypothetical protein
VVDKGPLKFVLLVAGATAFIWLTSLSLPDVVASHFAVDGTANGSMSRGAYLGVMLAVVIGLPALITVVSYFALAAPRARINLPNRDYWLAPERRAGTVSYLRAQLARFSAVLLVFLCYVHWLVVRANVIRPPRLSAPWINVGLVGFAVFAIVWTRLIVRRFRNRPLGRSG